MDRMIQQINLYQAEFRREKPRFDAMQMLAATIVLVLLLGVLSAWAYWDLHSQQRLLADLQSSQQQQQATLQSLKDKLSSMKSNQLLEARQRSLSDELRDADRLANLLANKIETPAHPYSAFFRAFAENVIDGLWLTQLTVSGNGEQVSVGGFALRGELIPQLLQALNASPVFAGQTFADVSLDRSQSDNRQLIGFQMMTRRADKETTNAR